MARLVAALLCANAVAALDVEQPLHPAAPADGAWPTAGPPPPKPPCHGGPCGGMAHYPVAPGNVFEAVFDVPEKPVKTDGICYYIYFNIFFSGKGHGRMNQFVPQLMLVRAAARCRARLPGLSSPPHPARLTPRAA